MDSIMSTEPAARLLIIEDNEEVLRSLKKYFTKKNYNVETASNGLDGLKTYENDPEGFDLIITDLVMPNISGVAIISLVKKKSPTTPVIAITGWGEHPEALATEAQADLVLEKPIELDKMDQFINDLLSKKNN
jgi:DNA-binding NtrC family response regulator